ncbi:DNA polymerase III subunit gamma/tau [Glaciibacter flavus]|uniref:DNA polymerase III subunit gamma/tau n=1 Tax=Orlajensenia flava TaxID=2565934 RepID=UPI003B00989A
MTRDSDDDALGWAGDDDATLVSHDRAPEKTTIEAASDGVLPAGWTPVGAPGRVEQAEPVERNQTSSTTLIALGVLGGIYLLYTVGWIITATRLSTSGTDAVAAFMATLGSWLAVLAPVAWFGLVFWLTRSGSRRRLLWLIVGAIVLAPIPFVIGYAS